MPARRKPLFLPNSERARESFAGETSDCVSEMEGYVKLSTGADDGGGEISPLTDKSRQTRSDAEWGELASKLVVQFAIYRVRGRNNFFRKVLQTWENCFGKVL